MIVKVQRPLSSFGSGRAPCLIYDRLRRYEGVVDIPPETVQAILGDDLKGYFNASVVNGNIVLGKRVADQDW